MELIDTYNRINNKTLKLTKEDNLKNLKHTNINLLASLGYIDVLDLSECDELKEIPDKYFYNNKLKKILLPDGIERIGIDAFRKSKKLELLDLTNCSKLIKISPYAFAESNIDTLILGESLKEIDICAFANCKINLFDASKSFALKHLNDFSIGNSQIKNLYIRSWQLGPQTLSFSHIDHFISDIDGYQYFDYRKDKLENTNVDKVYYLQQDDEFNYYKFTDAIDNGALELVVDNTHNRKFRR